MAKSFTQRFFTVRTVLLVFLTIMGYGAAAAISGRTMISLPAVAAASFAVAALLGLAIAVRRGGFLGIRNVVAATTVAALMLTGLIAGGFLTVNYALSQTASARTEPVAVVSKYQEKHYRSKRISRNRYTRGDPYYVHCIDIRFRGGKECRLQIGLEKYRRVSRGDTLQATVERGLMGFSVLKNVKI